MISIADNPVLRIVGVEHMRWSSGFFEVEPREYSSLAFRIQGSGTIGCGGESYRVSTNDILYLPQHLGYTADYSDTELIVVHFVTLRDDETIALHRFQNGETLHRMFLRLHTLWKNREPGAPVYAMAQLYGILGTLLERETKENMPPHFGKAVAWLNANYTDSGLTVGEICAHAGISATVFRQLFRRYYQKSPVEYILDLRIEHARNRISQGMPIGDAAYESGFNDPKYFARAVKKRFGCTPKAFRTYGK